MGPRWAQPLAMMIAAVAASAVVVSPPLTGPVDPAGGQVVRFTDLAVGEGQTSAVAPMAAADDSSFTVRVAGGTAVPVRVANPGQVVMGTLTVLDPVGAGHTRVYPCAEGRPEASTSNYPAGGRIANFVTVKADANGYVCFFSAASTHLLWDQAVETTALAAHQPVRLLNTVAEPAAMKANSTRRVKVAAPNQTVVGNLTVVRAAGSGTVLVYPCAEGPLTGPATPFTVGSTIASGLMVKADAKGEVCFFTTASTHLLWDQSAETSVLTAKQPQRLLDTRGQRLPAAGATLRVKVAAGRQTVAGKLTAMLTGGLGYLTPYGCADGRPAASVTAYTAGQTVSTYTVVRTDAKGELCIYTSAPAHVLWDQNVVTTAISAHAPVRTLETRPRTESSRYAFAGLAAGAPVRWNPCVPAVRVAVNWGTQAPEQANLLTALKRVRDATGIPLVLAGATSTVPRYNNSFGFIGAPANTDVVLAFTQPGGTDLLTGKEYGAGGFINDPNGQRIRRGFVVIDEKLLAKQGQAARVALYMHELGHVVGLDHMSADTTQVMHPYLGKSNTSGAWGNGDVSGLRRVGLGAGCLP